MRVFLTILCYFYFLRAFSSSPEITVIHQGKGTATDSSYYDLLKINESTFLVAGKYGVLQTINNKGIIRSHKHPLLGEDIFRLIQLSPDSVLACADHGNLMFYNIHNGGYRIKHFQGMDSYCMYNACLVNNKELFVCGGKSAIAHSKRVIPFGFIMRSDDGGVTWKKVYSSPFHMVWCVIHDSARQQLNALVYRPNSSHILKSRIEKNHFRHLKRIGKGMYHELQQDASGGWTATGGTLGKEGWYKSSFSVKKMFNTGMIWSRGTCHDRELFPASYGKLISVSKGHETTLDMPLEKPFNLYECGFFDEQQALVVGSAQTVLLIRFND
ncbi:MAG: hypothetical protein ACK5JC_01120 [Bacteroidota bacterium]